MRVAVVGSGPTGVAAATVLSERGIEVDLFDGGHMPPEGANAGSSPRPGGAPLFSDLLRRRIDSRRARKMVRGSDFVFSSVDEVSPIKGAWIPRSLAVGGLSHVWGTACYPLTSEDFTDWAISMDELRPWYDRATDFLKISGEEDSLAGVYPHHAARSHTDVAKGSGLQELLGDWKSAANDLQSRGVFAGRSRLAIDPDECTSCGKCLSGCPVGAMWTSLIPLASLDKRVIRRHGTVVRRTETDGIGETIVAGRPDEPETRIGPFRAVFLAAGPLSSLDIARHSLEEVRGQVSLVDNDIYVLPFLMKRYRHDGPQAFQLSEAAIALKGDSGPLVHVQLYRPGNALIGPLGPIGHLLAPVFSRLVLGFLYLHSDVSRPLTLTHDQSGPRSASSLKSENKPEARAAFHSAVRQIREASEPLGLRPLPALALRGDPGLSGHVGGTLPMRSKPGPLETDKSGRLDRGREIYAVDLSVFPKMPAQNPTFTAVANAMRVASDWVDREAA